MVTLQLGHTPREANAVRSNPGLENRHPAVAATQLAPVAGLDQIDRIRAPDAERILEVRRFEHSTLARRTDDEPLYLAREVVAERRPMTVEDRHLVEGGDRLPQFERIAVEHVDLIGIESETFPRRHFPSEVRRATFATDVARSDMQSAVDIDFSDTCAIKCEGLVLGRRLCLLVGRINNRRRALDNQTFDLFFSQILQIIEIQTLINALTIPGDRAANFLRRDRAEIDIGLVRVAFGLSHGRKLHLIERMQRLAREGDIRIRMTPRISRRGGYDRR